MTISIQKQQFIRVRDSVWELPRDTRKGMRVPVRVFADDRLLGAALQDRSLEQAVNVASLPGVVGRVLVMPDVHQGYGMPIGGVMASDADKGIVSPGAVGYDINCGVRLLASRAHEDEVAPHLGALARALYASCPSGVGSKGRVPLSATQLDEVLARGSRWALDHGYATAPDLDRTEESGTIPGAGPERISERARKRGRPQLGTLGGGNHFIELDRVTEVHDDAAARTLGLFLGQVVLQIHCGSRGLGHQVCTDFVSALQATIKQRGDPLPDRELVYAHLDSRDGRDYLGAMAAAANFAFANRQVLAHFARQAFDDVLGQHVRSTAMHQVYDIAHNMAKMEEHVVDGTQRRVCVHRKGATRAFGPGAPDLPGDLRALGQPVLIPGSMGTASWVLLGTAGAMQETFGSTCHGAGRVMSRSRARKLVHGGTLQKELATQGVTVQAGSLRGLSEEAPQAYKDVDRVIRVVARAGIARRVAKLEPMAVVKG